MPQPQQSKCYCDIEDAIRDAWKNVPVLQDNIPADDSNHDRNRLYVEGDVPERLPLYATVKDLGTSSNRRVTGGKHHNSEYLTRQVRVRIYQTRMQPKQQTLDYGAAANKLMLKLQADTMFGRVTQVRRNQNTLASTVGLRMYQQIYTVRVNQALDLGD